MYYLGDLTEGLVFDLGSVHVSEAEIVDFATKFDPGVCRLSRTPIRPKADPQPAPTGCVCG